MWYQEASTIITWPIIREYLNADLTLTKASRQEAFEEMIAKYWRFATKICTVITILLSAIVFGSER
jgi:hypothetical protein